MIHNLKHAEPYIDFGFGYIEKEVPAGQTITVWLQTLYNQEVYNTILQCTGTVNKISNYEYEVSFATPGNYTIRLAVNSKEKGISLQSNILNLTVTEQNG